ncbi:hypothetical protein [Streptomyces microflavus]|uniref:hypothetical protein n=1 Tax=Streptomyces microflavus TaxID=1919 RepID=UPI0036B0E38B
MSVAPPQGLLPDTRAQRQGSIPTDPTCAVCQELVKQEEEATKPGPRNDPYHAYACAMEIRNHPH